MPDDDWISKVELSYTAMGLQHILFTTNKNVTKERGIKLQNCSTYTAVYSQLNPLVGFGAYQTTSMMALGFYTFTCVKNTADQYIGKKTNFISNVDNTVVEDVIVKPVPTPAKVDLNAKVRWWLVVIIVVGILVPIFGVILYMLRKNKIADEETLKK